MLKVGYIGLGLMGKSMARNIMKAGFPMLVYNRSRAAMDELAAEGAEIGTSPADVAARVDVVFAARTPLNTAAEISDMPSHAG